MADKILVKIGSVDLSPYIKTYKVDYNVLVRDDGRNAAGNATINIVNRKYKINTVLRPLTEAEMTILLDAIQPFVMSVQFWDTKTKTQLTRTMYVNTASPDMYWNKQVSAGVQEALYNDLPLNWIEL